MHKTEAKRLSVAEKLADHLLQAGLQKSSLRQIAKSIGTSDRMLMHYFENKEVLLNAALNLVSDGLQALLNQAKPERMSVQQLLPYLVTMLRSPQVRPYSRLWLELVAFSAGGDLAYQPVAKQISDSFYGWIYTTLDVSEPSEKSNQAALVFALLEGFVLLNAVEGDGYIEQALLAIQKGI